MSAQMFEVLNFGLVFMNLSDGQNNLLLVSGTI